MGLASRRHLSVLCPVLAQSGDQSRRLQFRGAAAIRLLFGLGSRYSAGCVRYSGTLRPPRRDHPMTRSATTTPSQQRPQKPTGINSSRRTS